MPWEKINCIIIKTFMKGFQNVIVSIFGFYAIHMLNFMMTSSNGNIFCVTGHLCGEFTGESPVNSPHKGQWRGALMFSLICTRINGWVNNDEAGDLRRHCAHYDVIVMYQRVICYTCTDWCHVISLAGMRGHQTPKQRVSSTKYFQWHWSHLQGRINLHIFVGVLRRTNTIFPVTKLTRKGDIPHLILNPSGLLSRSNSLARMPMTETPTFLTSFRECLPTPHITHEWQENLSCAEVIPGDIPQM